jgi:hypothetical protein
VGGTIDYGEVIPKGVKWVIGWHQVFINEDKVRKMVFGCLVYHLIEIF